MHEPVTATRNQPIKLEPFGDAHLDGVARLLADPDVLRFTRVPEPVPSGFPRKWLARYEAGRKDGSGEAFAAVDADGEFLGLALVPRIDRDAREIELGYIVASGARGRGVATEMLRRLTQWAFETGALRAYLIIDIANTASLRVAQRCGYVREGLLRSIHVKQQIRTDATVWSCLPSDLRRRAA
jgi:RimJ/RimL family protein N-acetyltransferase